MQLTCFYAKDVKSWDSSIRDVYSVICAYYDFKRKEWDNDFFQPRINDDVFVSHWMPLPASDSPEWIGIDKATPKQSGDESFSKEMLVTVTGTSYKESLIGAQYRFKRQTWVTDLDAVKGNDPETDGIVRITSWMPLPSPPSE